MLARARLLAVSFAALAPLAAPTAPAHAQSVIWTVVAHSGGYVVADLVVTQGDSLLLVNGDPTNLVNPTPEGGLHDITSIDTVNGQPLFKSGTIPVGGSSWVSGVEQLPRGSTYPYQCSVHAYMTGTIQVV